MPVAIDFREIRPLRGSQDQAFEELCCQLAGYERPESGATFIRKGDPDAGIECYWQCSDEKEHAWQAKFFPGPLGSAQWRQLDRSVEEALHKHPQLATYTVCMPIDLPDARTDGKDSARDKWNKRVDKWRQAAQKRGMSVQFHYWGQHEILERLGRLEHCGRFYFWFEKEAFGSDWFTQHVHQSVANAGPRYTPELNVELEIVTLFDALGRTAPFYDRIRAMCREIRACHRRIGSQQAKEVLADRYAALELHIAHLASTIRTAQESDEPSSTLEEAAKSASQAIDVVAECIDVLQTAEGTPPNTPPSGPGSAKRRAASRDTHSPLRDERYMLEDLRRELATLRSYIQSDETRLSYRPALLVVGAAGTGKTHLFCDVASQRTAKDLPTVLLHGSHFTDGEPWSQVIHQLGLQCKRDELLGALEAAAQTRDSRALILIDALNEGEGRIFWQKHLAGMLSTLERYPWVGVALSVRSSYERLIVPEDLIPAWLIRQYHHGFADVEYDAARSFFDYYGIEQPSVPLLVPEFQNPLFLKTLCQGLQASGIRTIPSGLQGITSILDFFIESLDSKLHHPNYLNYDPKSKIVRAAVTKLAELMANRGETWLPRSEARDALAAVLARQGYTESLFGHLIHEGVLAEDVRPSEQGDWLEVVRFSYERFTDHLICRHILDKHLNAENPTQCFAPSQPLGTLVADERVCWCNKGLVDALCVQLPERIGKELIEVAPSSKTYRPVRDAFVDSLVWRDPKCVSEVTFQYIDEHVVRDDDAFGKLLDAFLTVASRPEHPLNADRLHRYLKRFPLAHRDGWWSIYLDYEYRNRGAVDRLLDWAWSPEHKAPVDDETIRLCGLTLAWFLTTSNRFVRDRATKALVALLTPRIHVLRAIVPEFLDIDDPYVLERLFAVAYGCAMRSQDDEAVAALAQDVYAWIFKDNAPPVHILLRDYARGVIEVALHRGADLAVDLDNVRPPYTSDWPTECPTEEQLKQDAQFDKAVLAQRRARWALYDSVMGHGDFTRYIIGTNSGHFPWSSRALNVLRKDAEQESSSDFDLSFVQRWIFKKVLDLGWSADRFGHFDSVVSSRPPYSRSGHKPERIGKKYQWIAYHELLARAADNLEFRGDVFAEGHQTYDGPWQIPARDIDPSFTLPATERDRFGPHATCWWFPCAYDRWRPELDDLSWLKDDSDLPSVHQLLELTHPDDQSRWLAMDSHYEWREPVPPDEDSHEIPRRRIWYVAKSYIVRQSDSDSLFEWAGKQDFMGLWMPESHPLLRVFLGEFFWAPAFHSRTTPDNGQKGWVGPPEEHVPHQVLVSAAEYLQEGDGYDCSIDEAISIYLPAKWLVDNMHLRWNAGQLDFTDQSGVSVAFDPSIHTKGPGALLMQREALLNFLSEKGCDIVWTILGEKLMTGGHLSDEEWKGRLEINGAYRLRGGKLEGGIRTSWRCRDTC